MSDHDEPALGPEFEFELERAPQDPSLPDRIRRPVSDELFAVLCTQGQRQQDGQLVTVDGYLGIVTVGPPEFDLEGMV